MWVNERWANEWIPNPVKIPTSLPSELTCIPHLLGLKDLETNTISNYLSFNFVNFIIFKGPYIAVWWIQYSLIRIQIPLLYWYGSGFKSKFYLVSKHFEKLKLNYCLSVAAVRKGDLSTVECQKEDLKCNWCQKTK